MSFQLTRWMSYLGLAGSLALVIAPAAKAQVAVTGGTASGDAAFFVPTTGAAGNVTLFDAAVRALQLETVIGTTTSARFTPTGGAFKDVDSSGTANAGDTGKLAGTLSGIAFTESGGIVPFQGVATTLNFTLKTFTPNAIWGGSLITATATGSTISPIFLPVTGVTLSSTSAATYKATEGRLDIGAFESKLDSGIISLPPTLKFNSSDSTTTGGTTPAGLGQNIKFNIEGSGVFASNAKFAGSTSSSTADLNPLDGTISVGSTNASTKFKIETASTSTTPASTITGTATGAGVNIEVGGITTSNRTGVYSDAASTDFKVEGTGKGFTSQLGNNSVGFLSNNSDSKFKFTQSGGFSLDGQSTGGKTQFDVAVLASNFSSYTPSSSSGTTNYYTSGSSSSNSNSSVTNININITSGGSSSSSTSSSTSSFTNAGVTFLNPLALSSTNSNSKKTYSIYGSSSSPSANSLRATSGPITIIYYPDGSISCDGEPKDCAEFFKRMGLKIPTNNQVNLVRQVNLVGQVPSVTATAYKMVGPPSRVFPGLVGLEEVAVYKIETTKTGTAATPTGTTATPAKSTRLGTDNP